MTTEENTVAALATLAERVKNVDGKVDDIAVRMATKEGASALRDSVEGLRSALAQEAINRATGDAAEKLEREKVAGRLQVVEDRMEQRKYLLGSGIALGVLGIIFSLFGDAITRAIGG